ncbi:MAG: hypothetical protein ACE5DY_03275 [Mariprofundaceae bacterium]
MKIDIDRLTVKELIDLNHRIVERLKFLESMRAHADMMEFSVGERVSFHHSGHGVLLGILIKYNKKTVTILTQDGQKWNVSPHLLSRVKECVRKTRKPDNVVDLKLV